MFRKRFPRHGIATGTRYRITATGAKTVTLTDTGGKTIDSTPPRGATSVEAFVEVDAEFRTSDRLQFTRNNRGADRRNGMLASVLGVDPARSTLRVAMPDGAEQTLDLSRLADQFVRQGWVQTLHAAQGATADKVMPHIQSFRRSADRKGLYVAISRARDQAHL